MFGLKLRACAVVGLSTRTLKGVNSVPRWSNFSQGSILMDVLGCPRKLGSMAYNLLINGVYWGYNPFTNHLLTSWDIQVFDLINHYADFLIL